MSDETNGSDRPAYREEYLGVVGVDSGRLMLCDPAYTDPGSDLCGSHTWSFPLTGQIHYPDGRPGAGIIMQTPHGDGLFDAYAVYGDDETFGILLEPRPLEGMPRLRLVKRRDGDSDSAA